MSYEVDYGKLNNYFVHFKESLNSLYEGVESLRAAIDALIASQNIKGNTADHMRNYFRDTHLTILTMVKDICTQLVMAYADYIAAHASAESETGYNVCFCSEELENLDPALKHAIDRAGNLDDGVRLALREVQDIYTPGVRYRGLDDLARAMGTMRSYTAQLDEVIQRVEDTGCTESLAGLNGLIDMLNSFINSNRQLETGAQLSYTQQRNPGLYRDIVAYEASFDAYIAENGEYYAQLFLNIISNFYSQKNDERNAELYEQNKKYAGLVRFWGFIGDLAIKGFGIAFELIGVPKPASDILIGGTLGGAWEGYYTSIADQIENYKVGSGQLVTQNEVDRGITLGGVKGTLRSTIDYGLGGMFEFIGDNEVVARWENSKNPVFKHVTKFSEKYVEKELTSCGGTMTDKWVDRTLDNIGSGEWSVDGYIDDARAAINEEFKEGKALGNLTDTVIDYGAGEMHKKFKWYGNVESPDELEATHTGGRTVKEALYQGGKEFVKENVGEFAEGSFKDRSFEAGFKSLSELYTDPEKRSSMFYDAGSAALSGGFEDRITQQYEQEIIDANRGSYYPGKKMDKLGFTDFSDSLYVYEDKVSGTSFSAEVDIKTYGDMNYQDLCREAERRYGSRIGDSDFQCPDDYKWVAKFTGKYDTQEVTMQLVKQSRTQ